MNFSAISPLSCMSKSLIDVLVCLHIFMFLYFMSITFSRKEIVIYHRGIFKTTLKQYISKSQFLLCANHGNLKIFFLQYLKQCQFTSQVFCIFLSHVFFSNVSILISKNEEEITQKKKKKKRKKLQSISRY